MNIAWGFCLVFRSVPTKLRNLRPTSNSLHVPNSSPTHQIAAWNLARHTVAALDSMRNDLDLLVDHSDRSTNSRFQFERSLRVTRFSTPLFHWRLLIEPIRQTIHRLQTTILYRIDLYNLQSSLPLQSQSVSKSKNKHS